jgi:antitoxin component YwqK of YwqJK toxin-antitoxin module
MVVGRNWFRTAICGAALLAPLADQNVRMKAWAEETRTGIAQSNTSGAEKTPPAPRTETVRERYPSQAIRVERIVTQDAKQNFVNHGAWTSWDPAGNMVAKGTYRMSKRDGDWKRWFVAPAPAIEGAAKEGNATPETDAFSGPEYAGFVRPFVADVQFSDDKLVGEWSLTDAEGKEIFVIEIDNDVLNGKAISYYANGKTRRQVSIQKGVVDGEWMEWDAAGKLVRKEHYVDGCRLAEETLTFDSGEKMADGVYLHANAMTRAKFDWWTGKLECVSEPIDGKQMKQGKWHYWHKTGEKRSDTEYLDDKPVGTHVWWFRNGQKECEGQYADGVAHGAWQFWHESGLPAIQGEYNQGQRIGKWMKWNAEGAVVENVDHGPANVAANRRPNTTPVPKAMPINGQAQKIVTPPSDGMNPPATSPPAVRTVSPTVIYRK